MRAVSCELSRRDALRAGGITAVVAGLGSWSLLSASGATASPALVRSTFTPLVGQVFAVLGPGTAHRATLLPLRDTVRGRELASPVPAENAFALRLLATDELSSGLYTVGHARAGQHLLHLESSSARKGLLEAIVYSTPSRKVP